MSHTLVCPFDKALLEQLRGHTVVVECEHFEDAPAAVEMADRIGFELFAVMIESRKPLTAFTPQEPWSRIPIALRVPCVGPLAELWPMLDRLRQSNLRTYLPAGAPNSHVGVRILASLGVATALWFEREAIDWESLTDLAAYSMLGLVHHEAIEPFGHVLRTYDPQRTSSLGDFYFDNGAKYVHLDSTGRVALSRHHREARDFIADDLSGLPAALASDAYRDHLEAWRSHFLRIEACSSCAGWRVCKGWLTRQTGNPPDNDGCGALAAELLGMVEQRRHQDARRQPGRTWRP